MSRPHLNAAAGLSVFALVVSAAGFSAGASGAWSSSASSPAKKVYKSLYCNKPIGQYDPTTWACATLTLDPWRVSSGGNTTATFRFKVRRTLHYVTVCFGSIDDKTGVRDTVRGIRCVFRHKYATLRSGTIVKRELRLRAPTVTSSGWRSVDNWTHFYKMPGPSYTTTSYWTTRSFICVVAANQPNYKCPGGGR